MKGNEGNSAVNNLDEILSTVASGNSNLDVFERVTMIRPNVKSRVEFKENDNWKTAKMLSKQPKGTGRYKNYMAIHIENETAKKFRLVHNQRMKGG